MVRVFLDDFIILSLAFQFSVCREMRRVAVLRGAVRIHAVDVMEDDKVAAIIRLKAPEIHPGAFGDLIEAEGFIEEFYHIFLCTIFVR